MRWIPCVRPMLDPPRRFRLLAFDWDGTLADSTALIAGAIQQACLDVGVPAPTELDARHVIGLGHRDAIRHVAPTLAPERHARFSERYRDHYLAGDAAIPLFAGVREMLDELDERGFLLAVATGKTRVGLARALAHRTRRRHVRGARGRAEPHPWQRPRTRTDTVGSPSASVGRNSPETPNRSCSMRLSYTSPITTPSS